MTNSDYTVLARIPGHPLHTLTLENDAFRKLLAEYRANPGEETFTPLLDIAEHYAKKGDLLYPLLKVKYGITGPSDIMWTNEDAIRDTLSRIAAETYRDSDWFSRVDAVLQQAEGALQTEEKLVFAQCAMFFTPEEWQGIYRDSKDYGTCFGVKAELWPEGEASAPAQPFSAQENEIVLAGGHMTTTQLRALLNTIPMEITFIDADNINRFFNEGPKLFKRPSMALDREVFSCHPPKVEPMVRAIIEDFRTGVKDTVPMWSEKNGRTVLVTYMAVRDVDGNYLGTVELVQDMEFAKEHFKA